MPKASMGPRPRGRGEYEYDDEEGQISIVASMGPRPRGRGEQLGAVLKISDFLRLQWGHGLAAVESLKLTFQILEGE